MMVMDNVVGHHISKMTIHMLREMIRTRGAQMEGAHCCDHEIAGLNHVTIFQKKKKKTSQDENESSTDNEGRQ